MPSPPQRVFLIPTSETTRVEEVRPERLTAGMNDWIKLSREILQKKRGAEAAGRWKPAPGSEISEDHQELRPFGAQHCPALQEVNTFGWLLKWPATATFKHVGARAWEIRSPEPQRSYKYHGHSSFPEAGDADAISIGLGWIVITPPGWSTLIKNLPNNLSGRTHGINFAEGVVRTDQATIPLQVHAFIPPDAPREIEVKRGDPMCVLLPVLREKLDVVVMDDPATMEDARWLAQVDHETFANAPGRYRTLYMDDENPSALYPKLMERLEAREQKEREEEEK